MPLYMTQFAYTSQAWAALAKRPENRADAIGKLLAQFNCKLVSTYFSFGEYDGLIISEGPDEVSVTAALIAAISPGHVRATKTTVLLTPQQAMEAMRRAGAVPYRAPGQ